jgi:hypothetical protein
MSLPQTSNTPVIVPSSPISSPPQTGPEQPAPATGFVDRRRSQSGSSRQERRQFGSSHAGLSEAGRELAIAIDQYKVTHHRRYLTCDEMLNVMISLGYSKHGK